MKALGDLPKPVLICEALGMVLLVVAYLSIHDYIHLPDLFATPFAAVLMIFAGVALMIPAAVALIWSLTHSKTPLFNLTPKPDASAAKLETKSEEHKNDANH